jgi:hypothetical protein
MSIGFHLLFFALLYSSSLSHDALFMTEVRILESLLLP